MNEIKTTQFDFLLPCRRFCVQVRFGESEGLSSLEQFFLRVVAEGANTTESIQNTLGISSRMILDLCIDMLNSGYIEINRASNSIQVVPTVLDRIGSPTSPQKDWFKNIRTSAPVEPREVELYQELMSGSVFFPPRYYT